ncbi:tRNA (guanosine(46)-N7)-methyltransferase TrmB [Helicobacter sp. MIT 05-5294]|uniref:tRNA (guanosine(46)-N7)-methyltransferase TrmB n=1 Tax=Helicobacter sp. MIT 05-5294 TaxID=1548150 RepID=UPI0010FE583D|nr:tRNA (guanosine(46)-N7)-methyltransferase TrmB [Helicobacter sp. MIT 05-5294]TLD87558.1 tRNA (guanosine(46)-N7)-methyltransferase TrmB [Helicobacter sp. MIT 05-5294]
MPHFKTTQLKLPNLPLRVAHPLGEFCFVQNFHSTQNPNFSLLQVSFIPKDSTKNTKKFFLEIKTRPKSKDKLQETIVRFDKNSRISPVEILKNALKILMDFQDSILTHNLNSKGIALEHKLPFIKSIEDFLDFENLLNLQKPKLKLEFPQNPMSSDSKDFPQIWLEIGFGSGRHLLHNAKNHPEILHIGLEIHFPSLEQVARQIGLHNLQNILILSYDARIFLELLPSNVLDKIFVHFPVPWDKQPNRRILSEAFLQQSARTLKPQGHLQLRTDSLEYFNYAKTLAQNFTTEFTTHSQINADEAITSKYEARWKRENKTLYNLEFFALRHSNERKLDFAFDFLDSHSQPLYLYPKNFQKTKIVQDNYFLHLEDLLLEDSAYFSPYQTAQNKSNKPRIQESFRDSNTPHSSCLLKCSFGDFNYPQTRYVLQTDSMEYFRETPLPTYLNHQAHLRLLELIQNNFKISKES